MSAGVCSPFDERLLGLTLGIGRAAGGLPVVRNAAYVAAAIAIS
jgi:hypothetical protein